MKSLYHHLMRKSKLAREKIECLIDYFVAGTPVRTINELYKINYKTINRWYLDISGLIIQKKLWKEKNYINYIENFWN